MRSIGSRELKMRLGEVLREVRVHQQEYAVTLRGRTIARLVPEPLAAAQAADFERLWAEMDDLAAEIGQAWPEGVSAEQAVSEDRREL